MTTVQVVGLRELRAAIEDANSGQGGGRAGDAESGGRGGAGQEGSLTSDTEESEDRLLGAGR